MTFSTIQPIGKNPATMPSNEARIDILAGIVNTKIAPDVGHDQRDDGGDMRLDLAAGDQNQQRDDGYRRGDGRKRRIVRTDYRPDSTLQFLPHALIQRPGRHGRSGYAGAIAGLSLAKREIEREFGNAKSAHKLAK
jgi:hypothetical protein